MVKNQNNFSLRRSIFALIFTALITIISTLNPNFWQPKNNPNPQSSYFNSARSELEEIEVKGRAPKTGYSRKQFGDGWAKDETGCDTRNKILKRDLKNTTENNKCQILTGTLDDPYTGKTIEFSKNKNAAAVQIDHVVALSDAWQKGAQIISVQKRKELANDPLNLLASDGPANQQKGDADAASWLPSNKKFRCEYIARQIAVKKKYSLWITEPEKQSMQKIINGC